MGSYRLARTRNLDRHVGDANQKVWLIGTVQDINRPDEPHLLAGCAKPVH